MPCPYPIAVVNLRHQLLILRHTQRLLKFISLCVCEVISDRMNVRYGLGQNNREKNRESSLAQMSVCPSHLSLFSGHHDVSCFALFSCPTMIDWNLRNIANINSFFLKVFDHVFLPQQWKSNYHTNHRASFNKRLVVITKVWHLL